MANKVATTADDEARVGALHASPPEHSPNAADATTWLLAGPLAAHIPCAIGPCGDNVHLDAFCQGRHEPQRRDDRRERRLHGPAREGLIEFDSHSVRGEHHRVFAHTVPR